MLGRGKKKKMKGRSGGTGKHIIDLQLGRSEGITFFEGIIKV